MTAKFKILTGVPFYGITLNSGENIINIPYGDFTNWFNPNAIIGILGAPSSNDGYYKVISSSTYTNIDNDIVTAVTVSSYNVDTETPGTIPFPASGVSNIYWFKPGVPIVFLTNHTISQSTAFSTLSFLSDAGSDTGKFSIFVSSPNQIIVDGFTYFTEFISGDGGHSSDEWFTPHNTIPAGYDIRLTVLSGFSPTVSEEYGQNKDIWYSVNIDGGIHYVANPSPGVSTASWLIEIRDAVFFNILTSGTFNYTVNY